MPACWCCRSFLPHPWEGTSVATRRLLWSTAQNGHCGSRRASGPLLWSTPGHTLLANALKPTISRQPVSSARADTQRRVHQPEFDFIELPTASSGHAFKQVQINHLTPLLARSDRSPMMMIIGSLPTSTDSYYQDC